ncbi:MAG: hypothetical protein J6B75_08740 [Ruminococcus sp.]|nr:hypothetical protein [Ruminococcus sp.]
MRLLDHLMMALMLILIGLFLYEFICVLINVPKIKLHENKVRVKEKVALYVTWIIISVSNMLMNFLQYSDDDEDKLFHLMAAVMWAVFAIHYIFMVLFARDVYITADGVLYKYRRKLKVSCDEYKYIIDGDVLELYFKKAVSPVKFKITENKDELIKLLEENYTPYSDEI